MKSIINLGFLFVLVTSVAAECDQHVQHGHARAARAHRRQVVPRAHTSTTVQVVYTIVI
jgi:hypothetical protein